MTSSTKPDSASPVSLRDVLRADPVGRLLVANGRHRYLFLAFAALALLVALLIVLPIRFFHGVAPGAGAPRPAEFFATLNGSMMIMSWLVFVPVVWGFYAWQPGAIVRVYTRLNECLESGGARPAPIRPSPWHDSPIWALLAGILAVWEFARFMRPEHEFTNAGPWIFQSTTALRAAFVALASITYYMTAMLVVRQLITTIDVNRVFSRESVPVRFLHPDEAGGLRFLGEHAVGIAPLIVAAGLNLSLVYVRIIQGGPLGSDTAIYTLPLVTAVYLVGSVVCFTAPLWCAHKEMLATRDRWLDDVSRGFEVQQLAVQEEMRRGDPNAVSVAKLETARKAWDIGRTFPTWPLNVGNGRKFVAALLAPVVPIGLAALRELLGV